ncbi:MAG TPA: hypothetical protein VMI73_23550 [Trebonia sp.]|nr:hypothetical protein [Trebonia sp.]
MNLEALASGTPVAAIAHAASHLTGRQVVPGLAIVTVLLLTLVILFGPEGPGPGLRRQPRASRAADRPVDAADPRDPPKDAAPTPVPPGAL